ncbi:hypothetical protein M8J77_022142 [Diaphorina citri]|nr:hypothetical protein M8J77_022142 [Diaphorina citri]
MRERERLYIRYRHTGQQDALQAYKAKKNATNYMEVTSQDVKKALTSIKSKASGYDGVDITMIRISLAWFLPIITHISISH